MIKIQTGKAFLHETSLLLATVHHLETERKEKGDRRGGKKRPREEGKVETRLGIKKHKDAFWPEGRDRSWHYFTLETLRIQNSN